ncbi:hypothetical protein [Terrihabitans sp. B22-R8]|uniref:hypothetical protein n=1 Tax=Terrihabitans sp. B22-R8 TaxID=3425128 RepID=UPI00403C9CE4
MAKAVYQIVQRGEEWFVQHDGNEAGPYLTSEAAFEAAVPPASLSINDGLAVEIHVPAGIKDTPTAAENQI